MASKEARFKPKLDAKVDMDEVKKAVADAGRSRGQNFTVRDVKAPAAATAADKN